MHFMSPVCSSSLHAEAAVWFQSQAMAGTYMNIPLSAITIEGACHDDAAYYRTTARPDEQQLVRAFDCSLKAI